MNHTIDLGDGVSFFDYDDPAGSVGRVSLASVARSLSRIPRFLGHTVRVWSVAQHCLEGARRLENGWSPCGVSFPWGPEVSLAFLLHDASEAFYGDLPAPMRRSRWMEDYNHHTETAQNLLHQKWGSPLNSGQWLMVGAADGGMLHEEMKFLRELPSQAPVPSEHVACLYESEVNRYREMLGLPRVK